MDGFRPIGGAKTDGRQYGVTSDDDATRTGGRRHARGRQDEDWQDPWREPAQPRDRGRGLLAGGTSGFLAAALALGVANLAAAFVRPQASPIIAVGGDFIDRTPPALKNFAVAKFGENDKTMLLLGMYVTIALIAFLVGMIAWRQVWVGVAGIGAFGAFGAFVAYTRPESHSTDVIPALVGGVVGIVAIICLTQWTRQRAGGAPGAYAGSRQATARPGWAS